LDSDDLNKEIYLNSRLLQAGVRIVRRVFKEAHPTYALILGSGWNEITSAFSHKQSLNYEDIPCLGTPEVAGHRGRLILAQVEKKEILVFEGRRHWYEGQGWEPVAFPVYLAATMGVRILVLTNAAGGIRNNLRTGNLMVLDDHINAMGTNPLIGPHDPLWGPQFPDQHEVYDLRLRRRLDRTARQIGEKPAHGVYVAVSGPTYETPAEIAAFRSWGADAVGMSTVPEAILAHAAGLRVLAISCISNQAATPSHPTESHERLLTVMRRIQPRMKALLSAFFRDIALDHES
jgi:purine-nucleoside phosphorylase